MKNLGLKLFSVFIAILMWYYVANNVMIATISVPVEIENPPPDKIIVSSFSQQVQVKVSGPAFMVSGFVSSPPVFKITVPHDVDSQYVVTLRGDELSFPSAIRVIAIEPNDIEIKFDDRISRSVAIEVPVLGPIDEDWRVDAVRPSPEKVVVTGPRKEVNGISRIETTPIDMREIKGNQKLETKLRRPGVLSEVALEQVSVSVEVSLIESTRRLPNLPVEIRSLGGGGQQPGLVPDKVAIEIVGARSAVRSLIREQVIPFVRLSPDVLEALGETGNQVPVDVDVPKGVRVVSVEPPELKIVDGELVDRRKDLVRDKGDGTAAVKSQIPKSVPAKSSSSGAGKGAVDKGEEAAKARSKDKK